jgi:hypothetical protein
MPSLEYFKRFLERRLAFLERAHDRRFLKRLHATNETGSLPVVKAGGPVVSLTSYGKRVETVYLTVESIAAGSLLPSELVLWLDDAKLFDALPPSLERLVRRGLTINLTNNYGPHTKYYPFVESREAFPTPLVTADDDIIYPTSWLAELVAAYTRNPSVVNCHRARVIALDGEELAPYLQWHLCESTEPAWHHFLNGVSGVIYPPKLLAALKAAGTAFVDCCPKADDVWLHATALRQGYRVVQIGKRPMHFPIVPGSEEIALFPTNMASGNDSQIKKTYTREDIMRIAEGAKNLAGIPMLAGRG